MDAVYRGLMESRREDKQFREIYEMYVEQMYSLSLTLLGDRGRAAEVTKEAFAELAARLHKIDTQDAAGLERALTDSIRSAAAKWSEAPGQDPGKVQ